MKLTDFELQMLGLRYLRHLICFFPRLQWGLVGVKTVEKLF